MQLDSRKHHSSHEQASSSCKEPCCTYSLKFIRNRCCHMPCNDIDPSNILRGKSPCHVEPMLPRMLNAKTSNAEYGMPLYGTRAPWWSRSGSGQRILSTSVVSGSRSGEDKEPYFRPDRHLIVRQPKFENVSVAMAKRQPRRGPGLFEYR